LKLKTHLKEQAENFYKECDHFREKENIKIVDLQISTNLPNDEQSATGNDHYRNMAKFHQKSNSGDVPYTEIFERVKDIADKMCLEDGHISKLLYQQRHGNLVVICGQPGIGKTTLTKRMAYEMCKDKSPLFNAEFVFLIRFRDFRQDENVKQIKDQITLLKFIAPDFDKKCEHNITVEERKEILKRIDNENTFIIMDGLDEVDDKTINLKNKIFKRCVNADDENTVEGFILNLIAGNILLQCKKLITTRPHGLLKINPKYKPKILLNLQGLDYDAILQLCQSLCMNEKQTFEIVKNFLTNSQDLFSYCHTPVICIMVVKDLIKNLVTNIKGEKHYCFTLTNIFVEALDNWIFEGLDFDRKSNVPLKNISKFAYHKLENKELFFHRSQLDDAEITDSHVNSFFCNLLQGDKKHIMYFIHLMWQEFLAAVNIRLYTEEQEFEEIIQKKLESKNNEMVTKFLFGLCNKNTIDNLRVMIKRDEEINIKICSNSLKHFALQILKKYSSSSTDYFESDTGVSDDEKSNSTGSDYVETPNLDDVESTSNTHHSDGSDVHQSKGGDYYQKDGDDGEVLENDNAADKSNDDIPNASYFSLILPILGWVHEMGDDNFIKNSAKILNKQFCIEEQILPSDIPVIFRILGARDTQMKLKVLFPRFIGKNCSKYFFERLDKLLDDNKKIQVSLQKKTILPLLSVHLREKQRLF